MNQWWSERRIHICMNSIHVSEIVTLNSYVISIGIRAKIIVVVSLICWCYLSTMLQSFCSCHQNYTLFFLLVFYGRSFKKKTVYSNVLVVDF